MLEHMDNEAAMKVLTWQHRQRCGHNLVICIICLGYTSMSFLYYVLLPLLSYVMILQFSAPKSASIEVCLQALHLRGLHKQRQDHGCHCTYRGFPKKELHFWHVFEPSSLCCTRAMYYNDIDFNCPWLRILQSYALSVCQDQSKVFLVNKRFQWLKGNGKKDMRR